MRPRPGVKSRVAASSYWFRPQYNIHSLWISLLCEPNCITSLIQIFRQLMLALKYRQKKKIRITLPGFLFCLPQTLKSLRTVSVTNTKLRTTLELWPSLRLLLFRFSSTLGWNYLNTKWQGQDFQTTIVYENQNRAESQTPQSPGYGTSPGSQIVIRDRLTTETIVKLSGSEHNFHLRIN